VNIERRGDLEIMIQLTDCLKRDEQAVLYLRGLYERWGYSKVNVTDFEEYDLYADNRNFFGERNLLTFMNADGRAMALRPDVTLSIIKNVPGEGRQAYKLYYVEDVYRFSKENNEYRRQEQIGAECIGGDPDYANLEILGLALESLGAINERFVLSISHLGFLSGLLDSLNVQQEIRSALIRLIHGKNTHDLQQLLAATDLDAGQKERVAALCGLSGPFEATLRMAGEMARGPVMFQAVEELERLYQAMADSGLGGYLSRVQLDFSVMNDLDYYNSLVFQGYIENLPKAVLTGGRYDNLMKKLDKQRGGVGFAVYLDELGRYFGADRSYDYDQVIFCKGHWDEAALVSALRKLTAQGLRVRVEDAQAFPEVHYTYRDLFTFENGRIERGFVPSDPDRGGDV